MWSLLNKYFAKQTVFAEELAKSLQRDLPPKIVENSPQSLTVNRVTAILERCYDKASTYKSENKLGFLGRASFANSFRWKLKEMGYPDKFIDLATEGLVVRLAGRQNPATTK
jgi:hypothetical protein